jgi:PTS system mannose-specific IIB component
MAVVRARVDQRLIHGIVVNQWFAELQPKRYMVIDDLVSQDEEQKSAMRLSKPSGTGMSIIDTEKAIANFKNGNYDDHKVFIIVKEPETLIKLLDAGIEIPRIDIGIMFDEDGREKISKFISLNDKEKEDIAELKKRGIPVYNKYVPSDPDIDLNVQ